MSLHIAIALLLLLPVLSTELSSPPPAPYSLAFATKGPKPILEPHLFAPATIDFLIVISPSPPPPTYSICYDSLDARGALAASSVGILNGCFEDVQTYSEIMLDGIPAGEFLLVAFLRDMETGLKVGEAASLNVVVRAPRPRDPAGVDGPRRAIVTSSIVYPAHVANNFRPWFDSVVLPRMKEYADRVGADLIVNRELRHECAGEFDEGVGNLVLDSRNCAMKQKLLNLESALREYDRVLQLDDTVLIRGDTPDLFEGVPPEMIGGVSESHIDHTSSRETLERMCSYYGVKRQGDQDFGTVIVNSGVLLLSREHHYEMFFGKGVERKKDRVFDPDVNPYLSGDQGYINAVLQFQVHDWAAQVADLGFRFNYIGSLENVNKHKVAFTAQASYFVHATSGLLLKETAEGHYELATGHEVVTMRTDYLEGLDSRWKSAGL